MRLGHTNHSFQTAGLTLESISAKFGDTVQLEFEEVLQEKLGERVEHAEKAGLTS
jgi:hypothetical protein